MCLFEPLKILRVRQHPLTSAIYSLRINILLCLIRTGFERLMTLIMLLLHTGFYFAGLCLVPSLRFRGMAYLMKKILKYCGQNSLIQNDSIREIAVEGSRRIHRLEPCLSRDGNCHSVTSHSTASALQ